MPRAALSLLPTFRRIEPGRDAYVTRTHLARLTKKARRWWTFRDNPTTLELPAGKVYAKCASPFSDHQTEPAFLELMREHADLDVPRPTGYADVFHEKYRLPRVKWTHNAALAPRFVGGWQEALSVGTFPGMHFKYDLRSAYLWAGSVGLPDPKTYRLVDGTQNLPAVYRVELERPTPGAPYPFNRALDVLASAEEIETYSLPVKRIITGVAWTRDLDPEPMAAAIKSLTQWKATARMYWGRWAQTSGVMCHTPNNTWRLPSLDTNIVAAHLIVSRVKLRLWQAAPGAVHVFVDSVITARQIATGPRIGDFRLEKVYPAGVTIRAPGWYGPATGPLDKAAGAAHGTAQRERLTAG